MLRIPTPRGHVADSQPRVVFNITEPLFMRFQRMIPFGKKRKLLEPVITRVVDLLEANPVIGEVLLEQGRFSIKLELSEEEMKILRPEKGGESDANL